MIYPYFSVGYLTYTTNLYFQLGISRIQQILMYLRLTMMVILMKSSPVEWKPLSPEQLPGIKQYITIKKH